MGDAQAGKNQKRRWYLYEVGDCFETRHGAMKIIDRMRIRRNDNVPRKSYVLQCEKGHQYPVSEYYLAAGHMVTCKKCSHPPIIETEPAFAAWFVDSQVPLEKARYSHCKADFYCQNCGRVVEQKIISTIYQRQQVPCPYCTDGVSYPERYISALLSQMNMNFKRQYTVRFEAGGKKSHYKYDFYDSDRNLILETHGAQHFVAGTFERMGGQALQEISRQDEAKRQYAAERLRTEYIELDCRKSDPAWIRREAVKKLHMYPLHLVDWETVRRQANRSLTMQIVKLCQEGYTHKQIGEIVNLHASTVCLKLGRAVADGLFDGVTPRMLRAEQAQKEAAERRARWAAEQERRAQKKAQAAEKQAERARLGNGRAPASCEELLCELRGRGLDLAALGEYVNNRSGLLFHCRVCGQEFTRTPAALLRAGACPQCQKAKDLAARCEKKYGGEYTILEGYKNCKTPLLIRHNVCGKVFQKNTWDFPRQGCPCCAGKRAGQSREKFYRLLPQAQARGYTFVGEEYRGLSGPSAFLCGHCGEIWITTVQAIVNGRDHACISPCKKKTQQEFISQVYALVGGEYSVLGEYKNAFAGIKLRHNQCGQTFTVGPAHFTSTGRRCPFCCGSARKPARLLCENEYKERYCRAVETQKEKPGALYAFVWNSKLADARAYYSAQGHLDVPCGHLVNGYDLGGWVADQRKTRRLGRLSRPRIEALDALGIKWNFKQEAWHNTYLQLEQFFRASGRLPNSPDKGGGERRLYYWLHDQVKFQRKGKLEPERAALLEALGIKWEIKWDLHFETMTEKLCRFKAVHGDCIVPLNEGAGEEMPLGLWAQRMRLQMGSGGLSPQRAARLAEIGLPANNKEAKFQKMLALAAAYQEEHGDLKIPQSYRAAGAALGKWINTLRVRYGKHTLAQSHVEALKELGMVWCVNGE